MRSLDEVAQTRARQVALYGESLQSMLGRCGDTLGLTQVRIAELLGISAPMLSQLINGHRIKIGNPAAAQRLQWMLRITRDVARGRLQLDVALAQLQRNADADDVLTEGGARPMAAEFQGLCQQVAPAEEFRAAAEKLNGCHPEIAEFLVVFGGEGGVQAIEYADRLRASSRS